jgi:catechol-2,3-dioxygenase
MPIPHELTLSMAAISLDCEDPESLADFYGSLLGGEVLWRTDDSIGVDLSGIVLAFQRMANYVRPVWPGGSIVHFDLATSGSLERTVEIAVSYGATLAEAQPDPRWRVMIDPAGHPFCLTSIVPPKS